MRLVVGISGASGAIYGVRLLEVLRAQGIETHLVLSDAARRTVLHETGRTLDEVRALATQVHENADIGAAIASGSFRHDGMAVAPCSIKTLSAIANSFAANLLTRAADVTLKERRRLVLLVRETPLHLGHLRLMVQAAEMGAVLLPPVPAFYHPPTTVEQIVDQAVQRALDLLGVTAELAPRWSGDEERSRVRAKR